PAETDSEVKRKFFEPVFIIYHLIKINYIIIHFLVKKGKNASICIRIRLSFLTIFSSKLFSNRAIQF
ncbi:MAG: hypothetical protein ACI9TO_000786, partial [Rickettsiales bacterium]